DTRPFRAAVVTEEIRNNANLSNRVATRNDAPELPPGAIVDIGPANVPAIGGGVPTGDHSRAAGTPGGSLVAPDTEEVPERRVARVEPTPQPEPTQPRRPVNLSTGVIAGKATHKPAPAYPELAKQAKASGTVAVQVVVDEQGRVVSAHAASGHPLLRKAAVDAALRARFSPTFLSGQPVKVTGLINYNFVLN
ncbi:MAG TPA: energy transducer TonB, partial [Pyrinomonadaceae bacterium]|nr:energy transducer TonB [Pyrinomonadaceae bacterium]